MDIVEDSFGQGLWNLWSSFWAISPVKEVKMIELNFIYLLMSHAFHSFNFDVKIFLFETCPSFLSAKKCPKDQLVIVEFN